MESHARKTNGKTVVRAMNKLAQLHHDTRGVIWAWIHVILGFFVIILGYSFGVPLNYILANKLIELGAPAAMIFFCEKLLVWTFVGMGLLLIIYGFMYGYKKTTDTGYIEYDPFQ